MKTARELFLELGGKLEEIKGVYFPTVHSTPLKTPNGAPYLQKPGVALVAKPQVYPNAIQSFLNGFDKELEFNHYLQDPDGMTDGEWISKLAGQLCYMSFGPKRTWNKDAAKYLEHIKESGHGSVFEHSNFTFLLYGLSRSVTHELVRHRSGCGYSQVSQRYVSGKVLRFVERPEYQAIPELHELFIGRIDTAYTDYHKVAEVLLKLQGSGEKILSAEAKTDLRKKVQQCARSLLPNETEAPIFMTGNVRAWRHILEMRASEFAEVEIRELVFRIFLCLVEVEPKLFGDYEIKELPDGTKIVSTKYRKV